MILCGIDIRHQGNNAGIGIRQESPAISTDGFKTVHRMPNPEQMRVTLWDSRLQIGRAEARRASDVGQGIQYFPHPACATATNVSFTEEEISDHANHG